MEGNGFFSSLFPPLDFEKRIQSLAHVDPCAVQTLAPLGPTVVPSRGHDAPAFAPHAAGETCAFFAEKGFLFIYLFISVENDGREMN